MAATEHLGLKIDAPSKELLGLIARSEDRTLSYVARRGLHLYLAQAFSAPTAAPKREAA
jgi:hypothetical protein